eukprot:TRINITY_DN978_c0_g1_i1.p1 TRINITY_DN978_c0_g1~~TRINITY_DN978_c0_g1_i1.p1  ORF type:complete len:510 (+),score=197.03 TRINITY_DN978_c0_g1_i1:119-1531(+)
MDPVSPGNLEALRSEVTRMMQGLSKIGARCIKDVDQLKIEFSQVNQQTRKLLSQMEKLSTMTERLDSQLELAGQILGKLKLRKAAMDGAFEEIKEREAELKRNLKHILKVLETQEIDKGLQTDSRVTNLRSFVDSNVISAVLTPLDQVMRQLSDLPGLFSNLVLEMTQKVQGFNELWRNSHLRPNQTPSFVQERVSLALIDQQNADNVVKAITIQYDRLQNILNDLNPHDPSTIPSREQLTAYEQQVNMQRSAPSKTAESYLRVKQIREELDETFEDLSKTLSRALHLSDSLSAYHPILNKRIETADFNEKLFDQKKETASQLLQDTENLISWFRMLLVGYRELLSELSRREKEMTRQHTFITSIQKELKRMHDEEDAQRNRFYHQFGRFLPTTLFPDLMEKVVECKLTTDPEDATFKVPHIDNLPTTAFDLATLTAPKEKDPSESGALPSSSSFSSSSSSSSNARDFRT